MKFASCFVMILLSFASLSNAVVEQTPPYSKYLSIQLVPFNRLDVYALDPENIKATMRDVAEYQLNKYGSNIPTKDWLVGTFFSGFIPAYEATGDEWYLDQALNWGKKSDWDVHREIIADDLFPALTYLDLYFIKNDEKMIHHLKEKLPKTFFNRTVLKAQELREWDKEEKPFIGRNIWAWCDTLYVPAVFAEMSTVTGDPRYTEIMHKLYWDTIDAHFDEVEGLIYRNSKATSEHFRTVNGKKVFWSRGAGWVIGGLVQILESLPEEDAMWEKYLDLYRTLSYRLIEFQMQDGLWRSSVNDPEWYPTKESSGSAFIVYGLAKGMNEGWLPKEYFMPAVLKGWSGLASCITPDGKLGYSQIVSGAPSAVRPNDNNDYSSGAVLLAGAEMLKIETRKEMATLERSNFQPRFVASDAAWSAHDKEPVIHHNRVFYTGYVKRDGRPAFTTFCRDKVSCNYARNEIILNEHSTEHPIMLPSFSVLEKELIQTTYAASDKGQTTYYQRKVKLPRWNEANPGKAVPVEAPAIEQSSPSLQDVDLKRIADECKGWTVSSEDKNRVVVSLNVHPDSGKPLPNNKYQLFKGEKTQAAWQWTQLTFNPAYDQLHPVIVKDYPKAVFWLSGRYEHRSDYHCDILMSMNF